MEWPSGSASPISSKNTRFHCFKPATAGTWDRHCIGQLAAWFALAGVCAYDADQQETAQHYFLRALELARAADDPVFAGYVSGLLTNQALRAGRYREAIAFAEEGLQGGSGRLTPAWSRICTVPKPRRTLI